MKMFTRSFVASAFVVVLGAFAEAAPAISVGTVSAQAGAAVDVPLTFAAGGSSIAGIQFNLVLPASISTVSVTAGSILTTASKTVSTNVTGTNWTFVIVGINQTTITSGSLLTARIQVAPGAATGNLSLNITNVVYADPSGNAVTSGTNTNGTVTVTPATPAITSAASITGQVGVPFSYQITATNSPTGYNATGLPSGLTINTTSGLISGTPTATFNSNVTISATNAGGTGSRALSLTIQNSPCDVNNDGTSNAADLQLEVNMALGTSACAKDLNQDSKCNIIDIQRIANAILGQSCVVGP